MGGIGRGRPGATSGMNPTEVFEEHRKLLFAIAYRMLSSVMEAEDAVQEVYLRWQQVDHETIESPKAYLTTMLTRLCIDQLRSAQARRETYIGPWLPEPLVSEPGDDPQQQTMRSEAVSMAFLVLMEELSPQQRAAFLLREVFDYDYATIAAVLRKRQDNVRQLVSRARRQVDLDREWSPTPLQEQSEVADAFWGALQEGDVKGVVNLLAEDVVWWSDGGGKVTAARQPIRGAETVSKFLFRLMKMAPDGTAIRRAIINERPGMIVYTGDKPFNVITLEVSEGRIRSFWAVLNPDKLNSLPPLHDRTSEA